MNMALIRSTIAFHMYKLTSMTTQVPSTEQDPSGQRALWRSQVGNLPPIRGGKASWVSLVIELVKQIDSGLAKDISRTPNLPDDILVAKNNTKGAPARLDPLTWDQYGRFLKSVGLANQAGQALTLTETGKTFKDDSSTESLARIILPRMRLLSETLEFITRASPTIEEVNDFLTSNYDLEWKSLNNTRTRTDWLESLRLIEPAGNRRWRATPTSRKILQDLVLVRPGALKLESTATRPIYDAPADVQEVLDELRNSTRSHESRKTYNIWVPSPSTNPNKVQNLRTIINAAVTPVEREELLQFVADKFGLRRSSVDSMLPFLRASGVLEEIGLGVFEATTAAKAWISSDDDVNFIRIMHANMRFVGEMIRMTEGGATRPEVYEEAKRYGLNIDKSRWIASLLEDTGLIEQPRYNSLRATTAGIELLNQLPLAQAPESVAATNGAIEIVEKPLEAKDSISERLSVLSRSPTAGGLASGKAFEISIRQTFEDIGFDAKLLSGPGNTDVLVHWRTPQGGRMSAIVEVKSRSSGSVNHTDVSDVALEAHKEKHGANYVALIAPSFAGSTIEEIAKVRDWALLDAESFGQVSEAVISLGLSPHEASLMLQGFNGSKEVIGLVEDQQRKMKILTYVIAQLSIEAKETGEPITPRDISRDGRRTELSPTTEEIVDALRQISTTANGAILLDQEQEDPRFSSYSLVDPQSASRNLQAIAVAIDHGIHMSSHGE